MQLQQKHIIFYLTVDWRNQSRLHLFDDGSQHTNEGNLNEGMRGILYRGYSSSLSYLDPPSAFILPPCLHECVICVERLDHDKFTDDRCRSNWAGDASKKLLINFLTTRCKSWAIQFHWNVYHFIQFLHCLSLIVWNVHNQVWTYTHRCKKNYKHLGFAIVVVFWLNTLYWLAWIF